MSIPQTRQRSVSSKVPSPQLPPPARKDSEFDMEDGVVDMQAFSQILALDDGDSTNEFSKTLVWAWCDQAEAAVDEMAYYLASNTLESLASKAHYLKGSSSSLGLIQVSRTCQSLYRLHFPPNLAHFRHYSYQSNYSGSYSSGSSASGSSFSGVSSSSSPLTSPELGAGSMVGDTAAFYKPGDGPMDFGVEKIERGKVLLETLKLQIREASEWLCLYYKESDLYQLEGKTSQQD